ncbi:hypothetical protein [Kocuria nitroreducens]|uniref:hypothetical protein n=1 Tax=Kocuria nitroreducens TaxID=3058914 RepID=UPI0036DF3E95
MRSSGRTRTRRTTRKAAALPTLLGICLLAAGSLVAVGLAEALGLARTVPTA